MMWTARSIALGFAATIMACSPGEPRSEGASSVATDTGGMAGMPGMEDSVGRKHGGMEGMVSGSMAMEVRASLQRMATAAAESLPRLMPAHRQMAANLLSQMNIEMRQMSMPANDAWDALADSVRQDLVQMPERAPGELAPFMVSHRGRMQRLMDMHAAMSAPMNRQ